MYGGGDGSGNGNGSRPGFVGRRGLMAFILDIIAASPPLLAPPNLVAVTVNDGGKTPRCPASPASPRQGEQGRAGVAAADAVQQPVDLEHELEGVLAKMAGVVLAEVRRGEGQAGAMAPRRIGGCFAPSVGDWTRGGRTVAAAVVVGRDIGLSPYLLSSSVFWGGEIVIVVFFSASVGPVLSRVESRREFSFWSVAQGGVARSFLRVARCCGLRGELTRRVAWRGLATSFAKASLWATSKYSSVLGLGFDLTVCRSWCVCSWTQYDADNDGLLTEKEWRAYLKASETK